MPKKKQKKGYGPGGEYYRKRITGPDGKQKDVYAKTQAELSEKVDLLRSDWATDRIPGDRIYVFEYCAGFYARRAPHLSAERKQLYERQINKVICPVIGNLLLKDVTLDDLKDVLATRAHLSRRSQEDTVQILKQIFSSATESDKIPKDPSLRLTPGGKPAKKKEALTELQQEQLLAAVSGLKLEPFVMLGLYTGMRRGEICGLRWDCVHLDGSAPYIEVKRACRWPDRNHPEVEEELKSSAAFRSIPIPPQLLRYLQQEKEKLPEKDLGKRYVFASDRGGPVSYTTLRRRWQTIRTRSTASGRGIGEKIRNHKTFVTLDFMPSPHILRHTYITRLVLGKMDLKRVQYLAGHADPAITLQIYTSLQKALPEDLAADVWAAFDAADGE
jgi:integrase